MNEHEERLTAATRNVLTASNEVRIRYVKGARWITYDRANEILKKLDDLLNHPVKERMPCMLLVGETNNGKSELVKHFLKKHPEDDNLDGEEIIRPIIYVQSPPGPSEGALYTGILKKVFEPVPKNESVDAKRDRVLYILRRIGLKMLIIDEIHHLLQGTPTKQRNFLNSLKFVSNDLAIPIVGVGTEEAQVALSTAPEIANRFRSEPLKRWQADRDAGRLLAAFERLLPLKKPSKLFEEGLAALVVGRAEGKIGEMSDLLTTATIHAIETGEERITKLVIDQCGYEGPAARTHRVRNDLLPPGLQPKT